MKKSLINFLSAIALMANSLSPAWAQAWLQPKPWGNPVADLSFYTDNLGLAAVRYDGLYQTTNAGLAWNKTYDLTSFDCKQIELKSNGHSVVVCDSFMLWSNDFGSNWIQRGALNNKHYIKVQMLNNTDFVSFLQLDTYRGYAIGKSTDGGLTWLIDTLPMNQSPWLRLEYTDIAFESLTKGIVVEHEGEIFITTDGGVNLTSVFNSTQNVLFKTCAWLAPGVYMAAGEQGSGKSLVPKPKDLNSKHPKVANSFTWYCLSTDGGLNWNYGTLPGELDVMRVKVNQNPHRVLCSGRFAEGNGVSLFYSNDTAINWSQFYISNGMQAKAFDMTASGNAWAYEAEEFYQVFKGNMGSPNLSLAPQTIAGNINAISFAGTKGYLIEETKFESENTLYKTDDGGLTWSSLSNIPNNPTALSFGTETVGLLSSGSYTGIYRTTNGGQHWDLSGTIPGEANYLNLFPTGEAWLGGSNMLYFSSDYGTFFYRIELPNSLAFNNYQFVSPNEGYAYGKETNTEQGLVCSTMDGGVTWEPHAFNTSFFTKIRMINATQGYAISTDSIAYKIDLDQNTAEVILSNSGNTSLLDLAFSTLTEGYILVRQQSANSDALNYLYETQDGGQTWIANGPYWNLNKVQSFYGMNGMAFGENGRLLSLAMGYPVGTDNATQTQNLLVSPNPANDYFIIKQANNTLGPTEVAIYDLHDTEVTSQILHPGQDAVYVGMLRAGVYIVEIKGRQTERLKFIKL